MSKRKKPTNLYPVKDLAEANGVLAEIGALKRQKERIDQDLSDQVDQLKAEAEAKAAPILERIAKLENGLLAFAEYNKADVFGERRSKELTHGVLGYRKSTEIATKPGHTLAMVLGRLKELGFTAGIRTTETVNKDELRTWPEERLDLVGAKRKEKDTFWYEVHETEVQKAQ